MKRERPFRGIRRPLASDRLQDSSDLGRTAPRLVAFLFSVTPRDGGRSDLIFYATTRPQATAYAKAWATRLGHVRIRAAARRQLGEVSG